MFDLKKVIIFVVFVFLVLVCALVFIDSCFSKMVGFGGSGSKWKGTLYYVLEKNQSGKFKDGEIKNAFQFLKDRQDVVQSITYYKQGSFLFHHDFVVLSVSAPDEARGFWSVEKLTSGITIQFSKQLSTVKDYWKRRRVELRDNVRPRDSHILQNQHFHLFNLIRILFNHAELENTYTPIRHNCREFAKEVFNAIVDTDAASARLVKAGLRPASGGVSGILPHVMSFANHSAYKAFVTNKNCVEDYNETLQDLNKAMEGFGETETETAEDSGETLEVL